MMQENVDEFSCNPNKDSCVTNENCPSSVQSSGNIRKRPHSTLESSAYKTEESFKKDGESGTGKD